MQETLENILFRIAELERKNNNALRFISVYKNNGDGTLDLSDGTEFKPKGVPQASISAGAWRFDAPAEPGTQGILLSPGGETEQGIFIPLLATSRQPRTSTTPGTATLTGPGGEVINFKNGAIEITAPNGLTITAPETGVNGRLTIKGASVSHNDRNIGDTHVHSGVMAGPATTGGPV